MTEIRSETYERVKAATVAICWKKDDITLVPFGSGVNVHEDGLVATCGHVIRDAQVARDKDGQAFELPRAKSGIEHHQIPFIKMVAVFTSPEPGGLHLTVAPFEFWHGLHTCDVAVGVIHADHSLTFVPLGDSDTLREGDDVFTCGFPLGPDLQPDFPVGALFQRGIISGVRPHSSIKPYLHLFVDMTINPGNSGGPLCDDDSGSLIGIVNARVEIKDKEIPTGIGCAIPVNLVRPVVNTVQNLTREEIEGMKKGVWPKGLKNL